MFRAWLLFMKKLFMGVGMISLRAFFVRLKTSGDSARRRYHILLSQFKHNDQSGPWQSGTAEEYGEAEKLLSQLVQAEQDSQIEARLAKNSKKSLAHQRELDTEAVHQRYVELHHSRRKKVCLHTCALPLSSLVTPR